MGVRRLIGWLVLALLTGAGLSGAAQASFPGVNGQVAYVSYGAVFGYDAGATHRVSPSLGDVVIQNPVWAPDGRHLAWDEYFDRQPDDNWLHHDVFVYDTLDGSIADITKQGCPDASFPSWSADARQLAYNCHGTVEDGGIHIVNRDGSGDRRIDTGDVLTGGAVWSPVGNLIAFVGLPQSGSHAGLAALYTMTPSGEHITPISDFERQPDLISEDFLSVPTWSPDGTRLAYVDQQDLRLIDVNGGNRTAIASYAFPIRPAWSPDGKHIVFYEQGGGYGSGLAAIDPDGSNRMPLLANGTQVVGDAPDWQPTRAAVPTPAPAPTTTPTATTPTPSAPANAGPKITRAHARWTRGTIKLTFTVCNATPGALATFATDATVVKHKTIAKHTRRWTIANCKAVTRTWPAKRHAGRSHVIALRARDAHAAWSKSVRLTVR